MPERPAGARTAARRLLVSQRLAALGTRFAMVGIASGAIFAATTTAAVQLLNFVPVAASVLGYVMAVPLNYLAHRRFTFRSSGAWLVELVRFLAVQAANITVTALAMHGAHDVLRLGFGWGIAGAIVLVPGITFMVSHLWVFERRGRTSGA